MKAMTTLQILCLAGYVLLLVYIAGLSNLPHRLSHKLEQHLLFGSAASVFFLWLFRTGIYPGLDIHFLWLTACVLLLGFRLSIISASIALLGVTAVGHEPWHLLGINGILGIIAPISFSYLIYTLTFHRLPKHLFVYIFVSGFFAGAATLALKMFLLGGYYTLDGFHDWNTVKDNYLILIPLLFFPEGLLNGMSMTMLVIYCPKWVYTYHDKYYLDK